MNKELFDPPGIVRSVDALAELAGRINAEHAEALSAARASLNHARNAGLLLLEAKKQCGHGRWLPWIKANVRFSERTVQTYMRVAKRWPEIEAKAQATADFTIEDGLKLLAEPKADDPFLPDSVAWLQTAQDEAERIVGRLRGKLMHYPFVLVPDVYTHLDEAIVAMQLAREALAPGIA
jgi:hypothetical protein